MDVCVRPWGTYTTLFSEDCSFLLKKIIVNPSSRLSLQSHNHRSEDWVITSGYGMVVIGDDTIHVGPNSHVFIPKNVKHRIVNTSQSEEIVFVEVQVGSILEETDIVRYEDDYGRT